MTDVKHTDSQEKEDIQEKEDTSPVSDDKSSEIQEEGVAADTTPVSDDESSEIDSEEVDRLLNQKYRRPQHACQYCKKLFSSRQTKSYHEGIARCFGRLYTCRRCLKPFDVPWRLERHQRQQVRCHFMDKIILARVGNHYTIEKYLSADEE